MKKSIKAIILTIALTIAMAIPCFADAPLEAQIMRENEPMCISLDGQNGSFATQREGQHLEDRFVVQKLAEQNVTTLADYLAWKQIHGSAIDLYKADILAIRSQYATNKALLMKAFADGDIDTVWQIWAKMN